jgi:hypothetical protein
MSSGFIEERTVDTRGALVVVTVRPVGKRCAIGHKLKGS